MVCPSCWNKISRIHVHIWAGVCGIFFSSNIIVIIIMMSSSAAAILSQLSVSGLLSAERCHSRRSCKPTMLAKRRDPLRWDKPHILLEMQQTYRYIQIVIFKDIILDIATLATLSHMFPKMLKASDMCNFIQDKAALQLIVCRYNNHD